MGAKTCLLAFAEDTPRSALAGSPRAGRDETEALVRRALPGYTVVPVDGGNLEDCLYPPDDITYAAAFPGVDLLCDRRLVFDPPSELPEHLRQLGAGRRTTMHAMHSVSDQLAFAVWENGTPARSLSVSPGGGIRENIGTPYDFEVPYWAGQNRVDRHAGPGDKPYPLPFHPLELGEDALRELFGFVLEGRRDLNLIDPDAIRVHGFRVTDPTGAEQAARDAARAATPLGNRRTFRIGPDGTWYETER